MNAPINLQACATSNTSIALIWDRADIGETGFLIERSRDGVSWVTLDTAPPRANVYQDKSMFPNQLAFYRLTALSPLGNSTTSVAASAVTPAPYSGGQPDPTNLVLTALSPTTVNIHWTDNANSGNKTYIIERSDDGVLYRCVGAETYGTKYDWVDQELTPSHTYYYRVKCGSASELPSNFVTGSVTTPARTAGYPLEPNSLSCLALGPTSIQLSWTNVDGGVIYIERADFSNSGDPTYYNNAVPTFSQIATTSAGATGYTDSGLSAEHAYWYRLRTHNGTGNSQYCVAVPTQTSSVGQGLTYNIGTGQAYPTIGSLDWSVLGPGDTVRIHYGVYHDMLFISSAGTDSNPITIIGVPNASGQLPIFDGTNATTNSQFTAIQSYQYVLGGLINVMERTAAGPGFKPRNIIIDGFEVTNAYSGSGMGNTFTGAEGSIHSYAGAGAGIYVPRGSNITVQNCNIHGNDSGLFVNSHSDFPEWCENLLVRNNIFSFNGLVGSYLQHDLYVAAHSTIIEGNYFGLSRSGNALKDRSVKTVVRYNMVLPFGHAIDLVEAQDQKEYALAQREYGDSYVYGNYFVSQQSSTVTQLHYGDDSTGDWMSRRGILYFWGNTFIDLTDSNYTDQLIIFASSFPTNLIDARNNILHSDWWSLGPGQYSARAECLYQNNGVGYYGKNWVGYRYFRSYADGLGQLFTGLANDLSALLTNPSNLPGLINVAVPLVGTVDPHLASGSVLINAAQDLPAAVSGYPLNMKFDLASGSGMVSRASAVDIGAFDYTPAASGDTTPPAWLSGSVNASGAILTVVLTETQSPPVTYATSGGFAVTADGTPIAVVAQTVAATGVGTTSLNLQLASRVRLGQTVLVAYNAASGNVKDQTGNLMLTFGTRSVTNGSTYNPDITPPVYVSGTVDSVGTLVTLALLEATSPPVSFATSGGFTIKADGVTKPYTAMAATGTNIRLTMASRIAQGATVTATYVQAAGSGSVADASGNLMASFGPSGVVNNSTYVPDTVPPLVVSATVNAPGDTITIGLLEVGSPPVTFATSGGFVVKADGVTDAVSGMSVSGTTFTFPGSGGTIVGSTMLLRLITKIRSGQGVTLTYDATSGSVADASGNLMASFGPASITNSSSFNPDLTPPIYVSGTVNAAGTQLSLQLLEAQTPPVVFATSGGFTVRADGVTNPVTGQSVSGTIVTLAVSGKIRTGQVVTISYLASGGSIADSVASPNYMASFGPSGVTNNSTYNPDITPPVYVSSSVNTSGTILTALFVESQSLPLMHTNVSGFVVKADGVTVPYTTYAVSGLGILISMLSPLQRGAVVTLAYDAASGNLSDNATTKNYVASFGPSGTTNNSLYDNTAPVVVSGSVSADGLTANLLFLESQSPPLVLPSISGFVVTANGSNIVINSIAVSGVTLALSLAQRIGAGASVILAYSPGMLADSVGNLSGPFSLGLTNNSTYSLDTTPPVFVSGSVSTAGTVLSALFLETQSPPLVATTSGGFGVLADSSPITISSVTLSGTTIYFGLASHVVSGQVVTLSYVAASGTVADSVANALANFGPANVVNSSTYTPDIIPPVYVSGAVDSVGNRVILQLLEAQTPPVTFAASGGFAIQVNSLNVPITGMTASGTTITLVLSGRVHFSDTITVTYDSSLGSVADSAANLMASFGPSGVVNGSAFGTTPPTFVSGFVDRTGTVLTVYFLDATPPLSFDYPGGFTVEADAVVVPIASMSASGDIITLNLATRVRRGQVVTLSYYEVGS